EPTQTELFEVLASQTTRNVSGPVSGQDSLPSDSASSKGADSVEGRSDEAQAFFLTPSPASDGAFILNDTALTPVLPPVGPTQPPLQSAEALFYQSLSVSTVDILKPQD